MDEVFAPEGTISKAALNALSRRSNARGAAQLLGHAAALAATGTLAAWTNGTFWAGPALAAHGIVLIFLFAPLHETIHRTAFKRRGLNDAVAWVCGALLLLPPAYFRAFHFGHHRYTQDPARDPELATPKPNSLGSYLFWVSGLAFWRERVTTLLRHAFLGRVTEPFIAPRMRGAIVREARVLLLAYAAVAAVSIAAGSWLAVRYWIAAAVLGQPVLRSFLLAEHTACPMVPEMLANSRTTRGSWLTRRLSWNMPYHAEHHAYPALPFHALPAAHALLKDRIAVQASGYLAAHKEILAQLRDRPAKAGGA